MVMVEVPAPIKDVYGQFLADCQGDGPTGSAADLCPVVFNGSDGYNRIGKMHLEPIALKQPAHKGVVGRVALTQVLAGNH